MSELITVSDVMDNLKLGPNGGLLYCMEFLESKMDWLKAKLEQFPDHYILFDCPGQVELYTHHKSVKNILEQLTKWNYRLTAVHLVDSHYCSDASKFISIVLTSLSTMLQIALPHVNVLSKADLIEKCGKLPFNLDFFTDVLDLDYLLDNLQVLNSSESCTFGFIPSGVRFTKQFGGKTAPKVCNKVANFGEKFHPKPL